MYKSLYLIAIISTLSLALCIPAPVSASQEATDHQKILLFLTEVAQEIQIADTESLSKRFGSSLVASFEEKDSFEQAILRASRPLTRQNEDSILEVEIETIREVGGKFEVDAFFGDFAVRTLVIDEVDGRMSIVKIQSPTRRSYGIRSWLTREVTIGCDNQRVDIGPKAGKLQFLSCKDNGCHWFWDATTITNYTDQKSSSCFWKRHQTVAATVEPDAGEISCTETCYW